jgi:hypothetical protein
MKRTALAMVALVIATSVCLTATAFARPQLFTPSIGWIEPGAIICEETSDHICVVTETSYADTFETSATDQVKYRVRAGTELKTLNFIKQDKEGIEVREAAGHMFYDIRNRVEVAIIIPADWDTRPGHEGALRPLKRCHLKTEGKYPAIVSLSCGK